MLDSKRQTLLQCLILFSVSLLLWQSLPLTFSAITLLLVIWNVTASYKFSHRPSIAFANLVAAATTAALYLIFGVDELVNISVAMLMLAICLKLLIVKNSKNYMMLALVQQFLIVSVFLYDQSLIASLMCFVLTIINFSCLLDIHSNQSTNKLIKLSTKYVTASLPLAFILFVFLPKLPSLWQMPSPDNATVGLSDSLNPFDIAKLSKSTELAFRVSFDDAPPTQPLYWRAMIHENFDKGVWRLSEFADAEVLITNLKALSPVASYQIYAEPSSLKWLYSLDYGTSSSYQTMQHYGGVLSRQGQTNQIFNYDVASYEIGQIESTLSGYSRNMNLTVSYQSNPKIAQLAVQMRKRYGNDDKAIVAALRNYYIDSGFSYTLQPPRMPGPNSVDSFMFNARRGFCGHYASASAVFFRAAGIPARVVSGYLGGKLSPNGKFMSVYQYDAHAWTEVWLKGSGWTRFDATEVVSPDRLNGSLSQTGSMTQEFYDNMKFGLLSLSGLKVFNELRVMFEEFDYKWTSWVLGFNQKEQENLISRLFGHLLSWQYALIIITLFFTPILIMYALHWWQRRPKYVDEYSRYVKGIIEYGENFGVVYHKGTTLSDYFDQLKQKQPTKASALTSFLLLYHKLRYQQVRLNTNERKFIKHNYKKIIKRES